MNLCLIAPPNNFLLDPLMYPPLGILYIASSLALERVAIRFLDLRNYTGSIDQYIFPQADIYGITATTAEYNTTVKIKNRINRMYPVTPVVLGGVHASVRPKESIEEFDAVIVGEGERSMSKVLDGEMGIVTSPVIEDLDSIPFPARYLLRPESVVSYQLFEGEKYNKSEAGTTITSTRGCPFQCSYCASPCMWKQKIRFRSPEDFIGEIKHLMQWYNCKRFKFMDDNFPLNKQRIIDIMDMLEPMNIQFRCHTRTSLVTEELMEALKRGHCNEIGFGVETMDNYVLEKIKKGETVEDHENGIRLAKEAGLIVRLYLMVCLPFETWDTIDKMKDFIIRNREYVDKYTLSTFAPYPGCDIFDNPDSYNITWMERNYDNLLQFYDQSLIETEECSREELTEHRNEMIKFLEKEGL